MRSVSKGFRCNGILAPNLTKHRPTSDSVVAVAIATSKCACIVMSELSARNDSGKHLLNSHKQHRACSSHRSPRSPPSRRTGKPSRHTYKLRRQHTYDSVPTCNTEGMFSLTPITSRETVVKNSQSLSQTLSVPTVPFFPLIQNHTCTTTNAFDSKYSFTGVLPTSGKLGPSQLVLATTQPLQPHVIFYTSCDALVP